MNVEIENRFSGSNEIDVKFFNGRNCPAEIFELRRKGFFEERGFLPDEAQLQKGLAIVQTISGAMNRAYSGYVSTPDLGAIPFL